MTSSSYESRCPLPPVRRVITGHDTSGKAIFLRDEVQPPTFWSPDGGAVYDLHRTNETPTVIDAELSQGEWVDEIARGPKGFAGLVSENGSTVRAFDFPPGTKVVRVYLSSLWKRNIYGAMGTPSHTIVRCRWTMASLPRVQSSSRSTTSQRSS